MRLLTRLGLFGLFAAIVYGMADAAPGAFDDPLLLTVLALTAALFGALTLRPQPDRRFGRPDLFRRRASTFDVFARAVFSLAIWAGLTGGVVVAYDNRDSLRLGTLTALSALQPVEPTPFADRSHMLTREHGGHFVATARVNDRTVRMLVDTGSSDIALPYEEALRLGLDTGRLVFDSPVMTANGQAMVAPIMLPSVTVGEIVLRDVRASIAEPGKLGSALLGMSFLGELAEVTLKGDKLTLRQ